MKLYIFVLCCILQPIYSDISQMNSFFGPTVVQTIYGVNRSEAIKSMCMHPAIWIYWNFYSALIFNVVRPSIQLIKWLQYQPYQIELRVLMAIYQTDLLHSCAHCESYRNIFAVAPLFQKDMHSLPLAVYMSRLISNHNSKDTFQFIIFLILLIFFFD